MEQNRKPRDKSTHLLATLIKDTKIYNEENTASSINGGEKIGQIHIKNNEIIALPSSIQKN